MSHKHTKKTSQPFHLQHWELVTLFLILYDALSLVLSYFFALWLRFDCHYQEIPYEYMMGYLHSILPYTIFTITLFWFVKLYKSIWRFASYAELGRVIVATGLLFVIYALAMAIVGIRMPISYYVFGIITQFTLTAGVRFAYRFVLLLRATRASNVPHQNNILIIGAGQAGQYICRDIKNSSELQEKVCAFIDDNPNKHGRYINDIPVVGDRHDIKKACEDYAIDKIYIAIPSATAQQKRDILSICNETNCELKNLPGLYQLANGEVTVNQLKPVDVEDLLGRDPIQADMEAVFQFLKDKVIMVTGGGGSIGSELCRQIAPHHPRQLIIFDIYENNAYEIQLELKKQYPDLDLLVLIGSVRDSRRMFQVFHDYHPDIVYHAAAHKHVPLMEDSPCESIKNNAIGTYKTAYAAMVHGCKRFVLISTDKAVNPTNAMGASKRICEMICQSFDAKIKEGNAVEIPQLHTHGMDEMTILHGVHDRNGADGLDGVHNSSDASMTRSSDTMDEKLLEALKNTQTEFVAVRFGNVLGSNGSVIPLFKKQIAAGGPVTVTHPDIIRYFMTIPEAVGLVLQAGTHAKGGEIFVLDMGEPMKIDTLARNLIRLSGYKPDVDIKIVYTGLRPGEKLYEEKLMAEEGLKKTDNDLIHIGCPIPFDNDVFLDQLGELMDAAYKNKDNIKEMIQEIVCTYTPAD